MSDIDASWSTTRPGTRVTAAPERVSVHDALAPGTRLDEFEIVRVLGTGGFGIVYLARDHVLMREVAIKEFLPATLARRGTGVTVSLRSPPLGPTFAKGLESFLSEARLLASFDHRSLVKVHRFWRDHGTAYMAMQYYEGRTLSQARSQMQQAPDAAWLDAFIAPILGALELLHGNGVFHRDISPDNILILADGQPVLLDFGSARRAVEGGSQSFTAHLKPQFAPLEQYAEEAGMPQGPWTDLYALGATLHFALTGRAPTPSVVRAARDVLPALSAAPESAYPAVPKRWLATIDWMLALAPDERPQDATSIRQALGGERSPPPPSSRHPVPPVAALPPAPADDDVAARPAVAAPVTGAPDPVSVMRRPGAPIGGRRPGARPSLAAWSAVAGGMALVGGAWLLELPDAGPSVHRATTLEAAALRHSALDVLPAPALASGADPVALRVVPTAAPASALTPTIDARLADISTERPTPVSALSSAPLRQHARDRSRTVRVRAQASVVPVNAQGHEAKNACGATGLLSRALCVLNDCKDTRSRATPHCVQRLRAEELRQRRMERE